MANLEPVVTWIHGENKKDKEITGVFDFGRVDADKSSAIEIFFLWNNYGGLVDVPKMEDVTITTRDLSGGDGTSPLSPVEAVKDNWMQVRIDSLTETAFTPIGRGGQGTVNPSGVKAMGTKGQTKNVNADTATAWTANKTLNLEEYIKPTVENGFVYKVTQAGVGGDTEPTWLLTEGLIVNDGTAVLTAVPIMKTPADNEILGLANNTQNDGTGAENAQGNFVQFSTKAVVPASASTGKNRGNYRVSFRFV